MRAIVIKQYGGPEVLALEERPEPEVKARPGYRRSEGVRPQPR